jgi:hypothetical protein
MRARGELCLVGRLHAGNRPGKLIAFGINWKAIDPLSWADYLAVMSRSLARPLQPPHEILKHLHPGTTMLLEKGFPFGRHYLEIRRPSTLLGS